jgi:quinol monooxygenase YgiN
MFLRLFQSAVDPADVDEIRRLFREDVVPAFQRQSGCLGIELVMSTDRNAGGLLEGAALSRWESHDAMEAAASSREISEGLVRVFELLQQEPVTRVYEVLE